MIQPRPGDLVAIEANGRYYYAAILDRIRLFGGNWVFVFASSSERVLAAETVLASSDGGWHERRRIIHQTV